jgi:thiamine-monophosphate kinase
MKLGKSENALVAQIERTFGSERANALVVKLGDDAALWSPSPGYETLLTCDWFLEDSHFLRRKHPPDAIGWKCLARAVSDVAAMGGKPRCFLLSLALPSKLTGKWLSAFLQGLRRASDRLGCELAGGDTTRQEKVLISITVVGEIRRHRAMLRTGARPGNLVFVSGTLGEAQLGLCELHRKRGMGNVTDAALRKHFYPQPRLALGQWLAESRIATAMMDLSDGLSTDLPRLCSSSRVGACIDVNSLPVISLANSRDAQEFALHGGDDYELLLTVGARNATRVPRSFHGLRLTCIGEITRDRRILLKTAKGKTKPLHPGGWDPFRRSQKSN